MNLNVRDPKTAQMIPIKLVDNGDGSYSPELAAGGAISGAAVFSGSVTTPVLNAPTGRTASYVIAASNSSATDKAQADYVCTGTNDQNTINTAISALPTINGWVQGVIYFCAGSYDIKAKISPSATYYDIVFKGAGKQATNLIWDYNVSGDYIFDLTATAGQSHYVKFDSLEMLGGSTSAHEIGHGVKISQINGSSICQAIFQSTQISYCADPAISDTNGNDTEYYDSSVNSNAGYDINAANGNMRLYGGVFEKLYLNSEGTKMFGSGMRYINIAANINESMLISGCWFDLVPSTATNQIDIGTSDFVNNLMITGCDFMSLPQSGGVYINALKSNNLRLQQNYWYRTTSPTPPTTYISLSVNSFNTLIDEPLPNAYGSAGGLPDSKISFASTVQFVRLVQGLPETNTTAPYNNLLANGSFENATIANAWTVGGAGATFTKSGAQYKVGTNSGALLRNGADCYALQSLANPIQYAGQFITMGCWVYPTVTLAGIYILADGTGTIGSGYGTWAGTLNAWNWLTITIYVGTGVTYIQPRLVLLTNNGTAYFDGAICVLGQSVYGFVPQYALGAGE